LDKFNFEFQYTHISTCNMLVLEAVKFILFN
jgi:hypothetical protein